MRLFERKEKRTQNNTSFNQFSKMSFTGTDFDPNSYGETESSSIWVQNEFSETSETKICNPLQQTKSPGSPESWADADLQSDDVPSEGIIDLVEKNSDKEINPSSGNSDKENHPLVEENSVKKNHSFIKKTSDNVWSGNLPSTIKTPGKSQKTSFPSKNSQKRNSLPKKLPKIYYAHDYDDSAVIYVGSKKDLRKNGLEIVGRLPKKALKKIKIGMTEKIIRESRNHLHDNEEIIQNLMQQILKGKRIKQEDYLFAHKSQHDLRAINTSFLPSLYEYLQDGEILSVSRLMYYNRSQIEKRDYEFYPLTLFTGFWTIDEMIGSVMSLVKAFKNGCHDPRYGSFCRNFMKVETGVDVLDDMFALFEKYGGEEFSEQTKHDASDLEESDFEEFDSEEFDQEPGFEEPVFKGPDSEEPVSEEPVSEDPKKIRELFETYKDQLNGIVDKISGDLEFVKMIMNDLVPGRNFGEVELKGFFELLFNDGEISAIGSLTEQEVFALYRKCRGEPYNELNFGQSLSINALKKLQELSENHINVLEKFLNQHDIEPDNVELFIQILTNDFHALEKAISMKVNEENPEDIEKFACEFHEFLDEKWVQLLLIPYTSSKIFTNKKYLFGDVFLRLVLKIVDIYINDAGIDEMPIACRGSICFEQVKFLQNIMNIDVDWDYLKDLEKNEISKFKENSKLKNQKNPDAVEMITKNILESTHESTHESPEKSSLGEGVESGIEV